jgi:hypothetical protein
MPIAENYALLEYLIVPVAEHTPGQGDEVGLGMDDHEPKKKKKKAGIIK